MSAHEWCPTGADGAEWCLGFRCGERQAVENLTYKFQIGPKSE
jgi:hypothetical protein